MKVVVRFLSLIALLSLASVLAIAQGPTGSVTGNIKDQSGAVVPNAKVTITNPATGFTRTETSNGSGSYAFSSLPPATYNVTAEAQGFTTGKSSVQVTIGSNNAVDIALGVAGTGNTVVE